MVMRQLTSVVLGLSFGIAAWAGNFRLRPVGGNVPSGQETVAEVVTNPRWQALPPLPVHVAGAARGEDTPNENCAGVGA